MVNVVNMAYLHQTEWGLLLLVSPAPPPPRSVFSSRTSSWMPPPPTAERPGSWWRGRNTAKSSSCSNVSVSQAWQPEVTGTPSSSTAWKPSREFRPRYAPSVPFGSSIYFVVFISPFWFFYSSQYTHNVLKLCKIPLFF